MEIRIRTMDEIAADRLTIEVNGARLYTALLGRKRLDEAEASEARNRIEELTTDLDVVVDTLKVREHQVALLKAELAEQRQRADDNRAWAERAEGRLATAGVELADAQNVIDRQAAQLGRISGAIYSPQVVSALRRVYETWEPRIMGEAIRKVRDALGSPSLPEAASEPTSQA